MMHSWGFGGMGGGFPSMQRFEEQYHCYSVAYADKAHYEKGDKILLPPSAFDTLARLQVDYPMLFRLTAADNGKQTHSGVLEFTAEEGCCYIPFWMMQNLNIEEGALLTVTNVSLPKATFVKLQAQSVDFLEISNPRAVLEHALRNFSCVTVNDIIQIPYNNKNYRLQLKEVKPSPAACIIETDCNVDFDAPVGYQEPTPRSSVCPSRSDSIVSVGSSTVSSKQEQAVEEDAKQTGVRIVEGKIIRPDDNLIEQKQREEVEKLLASKTGQTGVQVNAAIPQQAPDVSYWAVNAGEGARLDGKSPAALKDTSGNEIDIRQLRAEAAARRAAAAAAESAKLGSTTGKTLDGRHVAPEASQAPAAPVSKRSSRVGSKYSRLKQSGIAFQGSAKSLNNGSN